MQAEIKRQDLASEFFTDELCHIIETSNTATDEAVSIARARVEPGVTTRWHRLQGIIERYLIISGQGFAQLGDDEPIEVKPGDVVIIPAETAQRIHNTGTTDLIFYCICTPRFQQCCYEDLE